MLFSQVLLLRTRSYFTLSILRTRCSESTCFFDNSSTTEETNQEKEMLRSALTRSSTAAVTASAAASSSSLSSASSCVAPLLVESQRQIRNQHNYRKERNYRLLNQRHRYSRSWEQRPSNQSEMKESFGHELEAFDNFGEYHYDARVDPALELCTQDLRLLDPRRRYNVLTESLKQRGKVKDGRAIMDRIRMTVMAAECFEELCIGHQYDWSRSALPAGSAPTTATTTEPKSETTAAGGEREKVAVPVTTKRGAVSDAMRKRQAYFKALEQQEESERRPGTAAGGSESGPRFDRRFRRLTIDELLPDDKYHMRQCIQAVVDLVNRARFDHPDSVAAVMRCAQIASNVGDEAEHRHVMEQVRRFVDDLGDAYAPPRSTLDEKRRGLRDRAVLNLYAIPPTPGRVDAGEKAEDLPKLNLIPAPLENTASFVKRLAEGNDSMKIKYAVRSYGRTRLDAEVNAKTREPVENGER